MKKLVLGVCFVALTSSALLVMTNSCFAQENPSALFYKADIAYEQGKFDDAIKMYEAAFTAGFESGNLYYNLANAYFKKGLIGKAILNYKRAERLIPRDIDLKANLDYAVSLTENQVFQKNVFIKKWFEGFIKDINIDRFTELIVILYILLFLLAAAHISIKNFARFVKWPLIGCCVLFIASAAGFSYKISQITLPWAIIVDKEAEAKYEPFESATVHFKVFQGNGALLLKQKGEWAFIKRPDGKSGWIKAASIEKI